MDKDQLRRELKSRLAQLPPGDRISKSRTICDYLLEAEAFRSASVVMLFLSLPHEVDTDRKSVV